MQHVAIIMDGNGRWAEARHLPRLEGHRKGADATRRASEACGKHKIPYLTLYAFSAENWQRPEDEVRDLMGLLRHYLKSEIKQLNENNIRLRVIGDRTQFDKEMILQIEQAEAKTAANTGLNLQIALSYGGRQEIEMAARKMAENGGKLGDYLYTAGMPDPDLLIRTGGDALAAAKNRFNTKRPEDLEARVRSSLMMVPVVLFAAIVGGLWFNLLVLIIAVLMSFEWQNITANIEGDADTRQKWHWRGVVYITIAGASLLWLRYLTTYHGGWVVIWLLTVVWATDIGAFFAGSIIGGARLAPSISPGKTWAGLIGGAVLASLVGVLFAISSHMPTVGKLLWLSAATAVVSQGGDLLESYVKRLCGVKDSGSLIPGHGGVLDRVDGFVTAAPFAMLIFMLMGKP